MKRYYYRILNSIRQYFHDRKVNRTLKRKARKLKKAKKLADRRHEADGKRYFVMEDWNGNLRVLNNNEIKALKRHKVISKKAGFVNFMEEALYHTK